MKNVLVIITITYVILLLISSMGAVRSNKIQIRYLGELILSYIFLLLSLVFPNILIFTLGLITISIVTWKIAPFVSGDRNIKHHLVRLVFHLSLMLLYYNVFC